MVPIFFCAAITIIIGVTAVANFVLSGPQRLVFYLALVTLLTVFSFHFSVLQNVTSLRLTDALETIPKEHNECRQIIAQQAADHHKADILGPSCRRRHVQRGTCDYGFVGMRRHARFDR